MKDIIKYEWLPDEDWKHYETTYYVSNIGRVYNNIYKKAKGRIFKFKDDLI